MDRAIVVHGLRKSYGDKVALDALDLEVEAGTVLGFLGPNGAGKTTVIRILSTVLAPDSGTFSVAGVPPSRPAELRRRIGVLPESAGYPPAQTPMGWLTYHAQLFGIPRGAAKHTARRLLSEVGLAERGESRIGALSRGMRQRMGIARALVNDPRVVFLDEPTLGLDPSGQRQVLTLVSRIAHEHGVTVMLSTHALAEVAEACSRVLVLNLGRVVADGTVREIVRRTAAPRGGVVLVPPELRKAATDALAAQRIPAAAAVHGALGEVEMTMPAELSPEDASTMVFRCLLGAGIPVLGFTLEGGRLSDAFLAVTEANR